jgi:20S proteasome alpha/beta subunit
MLSLDFQEEPMTLQVALIGKDGFVLASDKKDVAELWSRRTSETRKILVSEKRDLVCAFSGHPLLSAAATRLLEFASEPGIDIAFSLEDGAQRTLDNYERNVQATIYGDLIVLILGKHPQLWNVSFVNGQASAQPVFDRVIRGDRINPAVFFAERYHKVEQSVEELKLLAAHTVLEGAALDPTSVGGLDMLVSKNGETRFLEDDDLKHLRERSESTHKSLVTVFAAS